MKRGRKAPVNVKGLRKCRIEKGISVLELADKAGVSPEFLLRVESKGSTSAEYADDFARILGVKPMNMYWPYNENNYETHFIWNLRMEREQKGLSVSELSTKCGIPTMALLEIEKVNKKATWHQISKICIGLNIAENQLLLSKDALDMKVLDKHTFLYKTDDFKGIRLALGIEQDELAKDMKIPVERLRLIEDGEGKVTKDIQLSFFKWLHLYRNKVSIVVE